MYYRIAGNFGRKLNLVVWWIDQLTAKLKSASIMSFTLDISGCGLWVVAAFRQFVLVQKVDDMLILRESWHAMNRAFSLVK